MKNKGMSVSGLANIGSLIGRADLPTAPPKNAAASRRTKEQIVTKTLGYFGEGSAALYRRYIEAAVRDAYNLGHADALDQNSAVEKLLEKQFDARTKVTMPAVVAGVMEQQGLSSMTLDLAMMSTVFDRLNIEYTLSDEDVIEYMVRPVGEVDA